MPKKSITSILLVSLLLTSCGSTPIPEMQTEMPKKSVTTETAKSDYFTERVKLIGKIAPSKETTISAQVSGIIQTIDATVGKTVKKGDILATLDFSTTSVGANLDNAKTAYSNTLTNYELTKESVEKDIENARIVLENARTNRKNAYDSTEKQIALAQTQLDNILVQKANTEKTTALSIDLATKSRDQAKTALENFLKTSEDTLMGERDATSGLYSSTQVSMENALITVENTLTQADNILGVTDANKHLNDSYEVYLAAKNTALKSLAENAFSTTFATYRTIMDAKKSSSGATDKRLADIVSLVKSTVSLYDRLVSVLDNSITSSQFPQTSLDALKATVSAKQSVLTQTDASLVTLSNSITTTRSSLETALSIAETNLQNAIAGTTASFDGVSGNETVLRIQLENTLATAKNTRDTADSSVRTAEAQYASARAKLQSQLTGAKSQLDASKGQKDIAGIQAENGIIRAPFDGTVLARFSELGNLVNPWTPIFTIGGDNGIVVRMEVNSEIVGSFAIGQEVTVLKNEKTFIGSTSLIAPGADSTTRMFRVEAILALNPLSENGKVLRIGDFVDVFVVRMKSETKTITVPFSALMSDGQGGFIIYVVNSDNIAERKSVKIGAQNESRVEILSGISEGERVVISGALNLQEGERVKEEGAKN